MQQLFFLLGVERLLLFGKEGGYENKDILILVFILKEENRCSLGKEFTGTSSITAERGLALPNDMTLQGSQVKLDFALNRFKGSLEGASVICLIILGIRQSV